MVRKPLNNIENHLTNLGKITRLIMKKRNKGENRKKISISNNHQEARLHPYLEARYLES